MNNRVGKVRDERVLLFCLFNLCVNQIFAQTVIAGAISNQSGSSLSNASITYTLPHSESIIGFTLSNKDGNYQLNLANLKDDSIRIQVSHVGYIKKEVVVKNTSTQIDFILVATDNSLLPEVVAKAYISPIFRRKDTLNYTTDSFLSKQDRVLSDVIKKLPGIEMNGDQILYQGKPLNKFYVEGLDLLGGRYGVINDNLPIQDVKKVQIIENHQPIRILDSLVPSDQASLNVVLKKFRTTGSGKLAVGANPLLWDVAVTPMSFFKNFQMVNSYQTNNTGNTASDQLKYLTSESNPANTSVEKYVSIRAAVRPPFEENRWLNNNINLLNSNILFKTKNGLQWKASATYINDFQKNESYNKTTLILPEENIVVTEDVDNRYNINDLSGIFMVEKNEDNIFFKNQTSIGKRWNSSLGLINRNNETDIHQHEMDETFFISNILNVTTRWKKQLIGINSTISYAEMPQLLAITPGQFTEILTDSLPYTQAQQRVFYKNFKAINSVNFTKRLGLIDVNINAGAAFQNQRLQSNIQIDDGGELATALFGNNVTFMRPQIYFNPDFRFLKNRWQVSLLTTASWQMFAANYNQIANDSTRIYRIILNPTLNVRYTFSPKWELSSSINHTNDFGSQTQLFTGYILSRYNNLERSISRRVSEGYTQNGNLLLKYENPLKSRFANVAFSYSQSQSNYLYRNRYDSLGLLNSEMLKLDNKRNSFKLNVFASQYFREIKTVAKLSGNYTTGKSDQLINDQFVKLNSTNYGTAIEFTSSFSDNLNFEYKYQLSASDSRYKEKVINTSTIQTHALAIYLFLKSQTLSAYGNYYSFNMYNNTEQFLLNLKYTFTLPKSKIDFTINCNNILNTKYFITQYNTAYELAYSELYLRPRQILVGVRFNFR